MKKKSWKTTGLAIAQAVNLLSAAAAANLDADPETVVSIGATIAALIVIVQGYFTRDDDVTSEQSGAKTSPEKPTA